MFNFSIRNGTLFSALPSPQVQRGDLVVEKGQIVAVGPGVATADAIDAKGALVLPGLVNAHTHLYSALACGMPGPASPPQNFVEILERIWWRLDRALNRESLICSALIGGLEAARSGVTVVFDHHASPKHIEGSLDLIAEGLAAVGIQGLLCYEVTDRNGAVGTQAGLDENARYIREEQRPSRGLIGGHASFTLSQETIQALGSLSRKLRRGFHIHVAEDGADLTPGDPIQRYDEATLLGPDTILAHGVHLNPESLKKAADRGCTLVHNPRSNMNNAVGYARGVADYPRVAVGTDGIGSDILTELRTAFLQAREAKLPDAWGLTDRLFRGGFELAQHHLGGERGRLSVGAVGDVILTDYIPPTPLRADNYLGHLLFGFDRSHIRQVWCRGRQVWPTSLDMVEITERSRNAAETLWKHMGDLDG